MLTLDVCFCFGGAFCVMGCLFCFRCVGCMWFCCVGSVSGFGMPPFVGFVLGISCVGGS